MENETNVNAQQPNEPTNTEPAGASTGGGDPKPTTPAQNTESNKEPQKADEKDDTLSSEELAEFRKWQESQKSDAENRRRQSVKLIKHDLRQRKERQQLN